jgi:hypothetical protein
MVTVLITSAGNGQISEFDMVLDGLTLTSRSGETASLISTPIHAEFLHVNGVSEPLLSVSVPSGVYVAATASVGSSEFRCVALAPSNGNIVSATFAYGYTPQANVTASLPSPITIAGDNEVVLLSLQASQSASYNAGDCATTDNFSITPTFTLTPAGNTSQTEVDLRGLINAAPGEGGSFTVIAADGQGCGSNGCGSLVSGPVWQVAVDASTAYQGIGGFSELGAGTAVEADAALQPDGSMLAKRIAVYDTDTSNLSIVIGPGLRVQDAAPVFFPTEGLGPLNLDLYPFTFGGTTFQLSGRFGNLQALPFLASFSAANVAPGQNIYATAHSLELEPAPIYLPATTLTLIPQTINGAVSAIGSVNGFTTYTISLAPYDVFPQFAVQSGQTTLLTDPATVIVYADSSTQMLNTAPIAVGSVVRFYGLVFNDNGTLRMDCAQINDGVAE